MDNPSPADAARANERYTHGHHESVLRAHRWRTAENSAGYLLGELAVGRSLLDVGCGPGTITFGLAEKVAPGAVIGLDASSTALEEARASLAASPRPNLSFVDGDVYALDFADGSFDVVHAHQLLQHLADPVAALAEMRRVCRAGGVVAARDADYRAMTWFPRLPGLERWMAIYQQLARRNGGEPDAGRELKAWALRAGFSSVEPSASVWLFSEPEDREYWGEIWAARVTESNFAEQAIDAGFADRGELSEIAEAWHQWVANPESWFAVLHGEIRCRP